MPETSATPVPTRGFWIISSLALVWNLIGVVTYLTTVTTSPEALAALPEAERALYTDTPGWVTSAYAIAVWGGSLGLLLRQAWAVPVFVISLVAILVQMGHALFMSALLEVQGAAAAILPLLIVVIAAYLVWFSRSAAQRGWIR